MKHTSPCKLLFALLLAALLTCSSALALSPPFDPDKRPKGPLIVLDYIQVQKSELEINELLIKFDVTFYQNLRDRVIATELIIDDVLIYRDELCSYKNVAQCPTNSPFTLRLDTERFDITTRQIKVGVTSIFGSHTLKIVPPKLFEKFIKAEGGEDAPKEESEDNSDDNDSSDTSPDTKQESTFKQELQKLVDEIYFSHESQIDTIDEEKTLYLLNLANAVHAFIEIFGDELGSSKRDKRLSKRSKRALQKASTAKRERKKKRFLKKSIRIIGKLKKRLEKG